MAAGRRKLCSMEIPESVMSEPTSTYLPTLKSLAYQLQEYPYNSHQYQYQCLCVGGSWYFALAAQKNGAGSALQLRERERHGGSWCHSWLADPRQPAMTPVDIMRGGCAPPHLPLLYALGPRENGSFGWGPVLLLASYCCWPASAPLESQPAG